MIKKDSSGADFVFKPIENFQFDYDKHIQPLIDEVSISIAILESSLKNSANPTATPIVTEMVNEIIKTETTRIIDSMSDYYYNILLHYKTSDAIVNFIVCHLTIKVVEKGLKFNSTIGFVSDQVVEH